jgi:hypothetical protein
MLGFDFLLLAGTPSLSPDFYAGRNLNIARTITDGRG